MRAVLEALLGGLAVASFIAWIPLAALIVQDPAGPDAPTWLYPTACVLTLIEIAGMLVVMGGMVLMGAGFEAR